MKSTVSGRPLDIAVHDLAGCQDEIAKGEADIRGATYTADDRHPAPGLTIRLVTTYGAEITARWLTETEASRLHDRDGVPLGSCSGPAQDVVGFFEAAERIITGAEARVSIIRVSCAWCHADLGTREGHGESGTSHGICAACLVRYFPEMAEEAEADDEGDCSLESQSHSRG